jgi:hypothetical protein
MTVPYLHPGFYYYRYEIEFILLHEKTIIKEIKKFKLDHCKTSFL